MLKKSFESVSVEQKVQYQQATEQAEKESLLRRIIESVRSSLDINQIKQNIVDETGKVFKADRCLIRLISDYTPSNMTLNKSAEYLKSNQITSIAHLAPGADFQNYLAALFNNNGKLYAPDIDDLAKEQEPVKFLKNFDVKSAYACPLNVNNSFAGFIIIQFIENKVFLDDKDMELLKYIALQSEVALKHAEQHKKLQLQIKREAFLRKINETIGETLDLNQILNLVCKEMLEFFKVDRVAIGKFDSSENTPKSVNVTEAVVEKNIPMHKNAVRSAEVNEFLYKCLLKKRQDLIINNMEDKNVPIFYREYHNQLGTKSILNVAIRRGKEHWGILALFQNKNCRHWTPEEIDLMHAIAEQMFIAIRQAELYAKSQEAARVKSEFITNVSHEIRTPLNAILGFSQLLEDENCSKEKYERYLHNISLSAKHLLKLINSILDFSKIESGKMDLFLESFDCSKVIKEVILSAKSMAIQKNITIKTELTDTFWEADIIKFKQILLNLLSNAIKFTKKNGQIIVRTKIMKNELIIEVEDDGIGIAEKDINNIFKYFRQINSSPSHNQEGTGLGLALAKKLVELHNGTIDFESKKSKGSRFWFTLPKVKKPTKPTKS